MSTNDKAYKYRIGACLDDEPLSMIRTRVLDEIFLELNLPFQMFRQKLYALEGQQHHYQRFSVKEMQAILTIINRYRPYRRPISIEQLYYPGLPIGA